MAGLDQSRWNDFWGAKSWVKLLKLVPEAKHTALFEAGKALLQEVQRQITTQGVHDMFGRVRMWQDMRIGSNNGYVAVSPSGGEDEGAYVITNSLDRGHGVREPSGRALRYKPRFRGNGMYVRGYQFYGAAKLQAESIAIRAAEKGLVYWENAMDEALNGDWGDE